MRRLLLGILVSLLFVPWWCGRWSDAHFDGEREAWVPLADAVAHGLLTDPVVRHTGSSRFDGEWTLGGCALGLHGLAAVVHRFPDTQERYAPAMEHCTRRLMDPATRAFATRAWSSDALEHLDDPTPRDAWLGYVLVALASHEQVRPGGGGPWLEPLSTALERRLERPLHELATYPNEGYPCDQASVIGGVARSARARGEPVPSVARRAARDFLENAVDPATGWVVQARGLHSGTWLDDPRGSGTALSAFFLHAADPSLSTRLYRAHRDAGMRSVLGFGGMREYPPDRFGLGDIDSGPVVFGAGVSATGFALSGARLTGDRNTYRRLFRTSWLFGVPVSTAHGRPYATGGTLGNAILLAMLTAGEL